MVAGNVNHSGTIGQKMKYFLYHRHVYGGEIMFAELPSVYDVAIKYQQPRRYAFKISDKLFGTAGISAKVKI